MYDSYLIDNLLRVGLHRRKVISVLCVLRFCRLVQNADSVGGNESPVNNSTEYNSCLRKFENYL